MATKPWIPVPHKDKPDKDKRIKWGPVKKVVAAVAALVTLAAGLVAVLGYAGYNPFDSKPPPAPTPASVVNRVLAYAGKLQVPAEWTKLVAPTQSKWEAQCKLQTQYQPDQLAMKCWLGLSDLQEVGYQWQAAISSINRARNIDIRIADPYYKMGNLYYNLLLIGLIEARRYRVLDERALLVEVMPNSDSRILAGLVGDQYRQGKGLPFIGPNVPPKNEIVTTQDTISQNQQQITAIMNGASVLTLSRFELMRFLDFLAGAYPNDKTVSQQEYVMMPALLKYMKQHPDEFPGMGSLIQGLP